MQPAMVTELEFQHNIL